STETITFAEHYARVASLARSLREDHDVQPGDRVAIAAANQTEWIEVFWATISLGAICVGFNAWWSLPALTWAVAHSRPVLVVADANRATVLEHTGVPVMTMESEVTRLSHTYRDAALPRADIEPDDPAVMLYTSGASGPPKAVVHSHRSLCS